MKYSDILLAIESQFGITNRVVPCVLGKPGGGKTALERELAFRMLRAVGQEVIQYSSTDPATWDTANYLEFNASLRDPTDVMGTPMNHENVTLWRPPGELYPFRKGGRPGLKFLILEEVTDSPIPMQNALCSLVYDYRAGNMLLDQDNLYIMASGNRTEDKSGAQRVTTKFANRMRFFHFEENLDDWVNWALLAGIDPVLIQFIRFRPNLLSDFDSNRLCNPTPRSWERVSRIPDTMPSHCYFASIAGEVSDGAAAEYVGFRKIYKEIDSVDEILMNPAKHRVPQDPAVLYALTGALAHASSKDNFDRVIKYIERMPAEFAVMAVRDATKLAPEVKHTKAFVEFTVRNSSLLI